MNAELSSQAAAYVRRARAGDENAMAMLARIGQEARQGQNARASAAYAAIKEYIEKNPAQNFTLGSEKALVLDPPKPGRVEKVATSASSSNALARRGSAEVARSRARPSQAALAHRTANAESRKPPLPRGIFDGLFDPEYLTLTIVRACAYRHGLPAAAVVLASGPLLTKAAVEAIAGTFTSEESVGCFLHGVRFSGEEAWQEVAPYLDDPLRRCLAVGQCVGRARKIQAVRMAQTPITAYSEVAGWELGE